MGWSWGIQGLLDSSSFKPGCPDLVFRVVVLLLQEGGGDLWMPHGLQGIQAEVFICHLQKQQCCESNLMLKRILSEEKLRWEGKGWIRQSKKEGSTGWKKKIKQKIKVSRKGKGVGSVFLRSCVQGWPSASPKLLCLGDLREERRLQGAVGPDRSRTMAGGTELE